MPHYLTNRGLHTLANSAISGSTDIRAAVFKGSPPAEGTIRDYNVLSDLTGAMTEAAASGYSRADLASVTLTPGAPYEGDTLTCTPGATTDADGTTAFTTAYGWTVNGVSLGVGVSVGVVVGVSVGWFLGSSAGFL